LISYTNAPVFLRARSSRPVSVSLKETILSLDHSEFMLQTVDKSGTA
jgi:hypothetical protein